MLYGQDYFYEELGLKFKITPFSFFQTNSRGAEVLYSTAREFVGEMKDRTIFDLYGEPEPSPRSLHGRKRSDRRGNRKEAVTAAKERERRGKRPCNCSFSPETC